MPEQATGNNATICQPHTQQPPHATAGNTACAAAITDRSLLYSPAASSYFPINVPTLQHSAWMAFIRLGHFLFYVWGWTTIRDKLCCVLALSVRSIYVAPSRNITILHYGKTCQVSLNCVYCLSDPLALSALSHSCPFA